MALYRPDYNWKKGKELVDKLPNEGEEDGYYIRYYIEKLQERLEKSEKRNKEYQDVFDQIKRFTR